jgi:hypothetical protein
MIGFLNARADKTALWFPVTVFFTGIGSMVVAWMKNDGGLTLTGFGDSVLRIVAAIL